MSKHTLSVMVENKPGVLTRIAGLFSRRGFNIDSLAVGPTEHPDVSRMTVVVDVEDQPLEQVTKQLNKLVEVLKIVELAGGASVHRTSWRRCCGSWSRSASRSWCSPAWSPSAVAPARSPTARYGRPEHRFAHCISHTAFPRTPT